MKNGRLKNSITFLLLALFVSMKAVGLHALSHANDKDHAVHCTICDHAIANDLTPVLAPDSQDFAIENTEPTVQKEIIRNYNFIISSTIAKDQLFSRPPPFLL